VVGVEGVLSFTRKNVIAMAAGALLAGGPLLAFDYWVSRLIERQSVEDVTTWAARVMALSDARIAHVIAALDALAQAGVDSCTSANLDLMRNQVFVTMPIKEVALLAPAGSAMCTSSGRSADGWQVLQGEELPGMKDFRIEVIRLTDHDRMIRIRRNVGPSSLAALVPAELFVPKVSAQGGQSPAYANMTAAGGMLLGEAGVRANLQAPVSVKQRSGKYGLTVLIELSDKPQLRSDLDKLGLLAKLAFAAVLMSFALLMRNRNPGNPVAELEQALEDGEFIPYYQPIVDIRSGQLRGAEVLMRWRKKDGTLVLPGAFIPLAESSGLIAPMTRALMRHVCAEAGAAIGSRPNLKISFNLAARLVRDEAIVKDVRKVFSGSPIELSQVVLELTERDQVESLTETRRVIAALQGIGVRIAIDDVGTGHSGLSYMLKLGVDIIKIDKMFVDAIGTDRNSTTIVETLIDLAHNMRMDVIAEGVENFEQVMHLRELGVRTAQGYVFAPPLPGSAFLQLVDAIDPLPAAAIEGKAVGATGRYMSARNRFNAA
jgi:sensor c-di-GMP phosphodiesterase-like protein